MKNLFLIALITILTFVTCTKESHYSESVTSLEKVPPPLLNKLKLWRDNKISKDHQYLSKSSGSREIRGLLQPNYEISTSTTVSSGAIETAIGVNVFKLENENVGFFRTFVFLSKADKVLDGKIVEFYGDPDYIAKKPEGETLVVEVLPGHQRQLYR